jgi:small subunit ribosomal protein S20
MATDKLRKKIGKGRHLSSLKRDRQNAKRRARNRNALSKMRMAIKGVRTARSAEALKEAIPTIARTAHKGIIHRKKAMRLISRLTKAARAS